MAGNLAAPMVTFALLPVLTRYLSIEEIGGIFIFQAILLMCVNIASAGSMSVLQGLYVRVKNQFADYLVSSLSTSTIIWLFLCLVSYWAAEGVASDLGLPVAVIILAVFASGGGVLQAVYLSLIHIRENSKRYFYILTSVNLIGFLASIVLILFVAPTLMSRVVGIMVGILFGALLAVFYLSKEIVFAPRLNLMSELLGTGIPVVFHSTAMILIAQTDKFLIGSLLTLGEVGAYGISAQLASVVQVLASGLAMAYTPLLYKKLAAPNQDDGGHSSRILNFFVLSLFVFSLFWISFVHFFNPVLLGSEFDFQEAPFVALSFGAVCFGIYHFFSGHFYFYQYTKLLALTSGSIALVNLVVSYVLIPKYGINGAAIGSLIAYVFALLAAVLSSLVFRRRARLQEVQVDFDR